MRKEATLEQWKELYEVAANIKELKPWDYLWDIDIITLALPNREPICCSIMGGGGECFGVLAYIGYDAINDFYNMLERDDIPPEQMYRYQENNVIACYFGSRDELTSRELKIIKDLGLKFRGKNNWIYFHSFKKGYAPYILDQEEVLQETEILKHLYMSLTAYIKKGLEVDFEKGNTLMRMYNPKDELWMNFEAPLQIPEKRHIAPVLEDELLISKLGKMKQIKRVWELDIAYLGSIINDKKYERPVFGRVCILGDSETGIVINQNMVAPTDDDIQTIFNVVIPPIMELGKPQKILVRDEYIYYILKDLCHRTKIKLEIKGRLNVVDSFIHEFSTFGI